jgi:hypothetical protein
MVHWKKINVETFFIIKDNNVKICIGATTIQKAQ